MRVTIKGQVTIPQHIREKLGILPNSEVDFLIEEDYYDEDCDDNNSGYQDDDLNDYLDEYL